MEVDRAKVRLTRSRVRGRRVRMRGRGAATPRRRISLGADISARISACVVRERVAEPHGLAVAEVVHVEKRGAPGDVVRIKLLLPALPRRARARGEQCAQQPRARRRSRRGAH